jgi:hypothetical protein
MLPQETVVLATPAVKTTGPGRVFSRTSGEHGASPDDVGAFTINTLEAGRYRLSVRLFDEALYVRSIQAPAPAPTAPARGGAATANAAAAPGDVLDVKAGQQLSGIAVRVAAGAAYLSGTVAAAEPALPLAQLRVHLVPQERERAEDALRYYETPVAGDGTFAFKNLAPGRYLVVARPTAPEADGSTPRPAAWDATARAALRRDAESANNTIELQPCKRTTDLKLRFPPAAK